jgi:drug/metabolite transporter superfamily protein YnfA
LAVADEQAASLQRLTAWGVAFDGFRPDRYGLIGAAVCLAGIGTIMYAPR